ncbi:hypothetical protein [Rheinheimera sp.]|uniref:hypothetical protein n=1 Tax=Rheinheimera sp. TaxID=1869214 RepID=UPI0040479B64
MNKTTISILMLIAFSVTLYFAYEYFEDVKIQKAEREQSFLLKLNSLFITPMSKPDLQELCQCTITVISSTPITFTKRTAKSLEPIEATANQYEIVELEEVERTAQLKVCGLLDADHRSSRNRSLITTQKFTGTPFHSNSCAELWAPGRAYYEPSS